MNVKRCNKCGLESTVMVKIPIILVEASLRDFYLGTRLGEAWENDNDLCGPCARQLMDTFKLKGSAP